MDVPVEANDDEGDDDDDEESVAQAQERLLQALMSRAGRALPRRALERDWSILGELGSGSYGRVLLARPRRGGAQVALKLLSKARTPRCSFLREFCTHLCLRGALTCIQVLPLAFETPTEFGFAQELAPAGDLCGLLTPGVGLPEPQVKRCAAQVCSALSYLHGHALVHADLKLDNVLAFDRHCHLVKLGDFGLTRALGWQVRPARGPAPYAAPELLPRPHLRAGEPRLEPAVDTWALGVLLFALLTGSFPWASPARSDPAFRRFRAWHGRTCAGEAPPRPPRTWRGLGGAGLALLRGLLHPQPERRCPPGEVLRYLGGAWRGRGGQGSSAEGSGQVSPTGESGSSQVSSAEGSGSSQVSPTGESGSGQGSSAEGSGQVSPTGESGSGQVSSAEGSGQVSSAGESGSSQVSPTGESGSSQVSSTGEEGSGQVSSAEGSGQVSPAGESGSSQVSPTGEEGSGQVSSAGESSQGSSAGEEGSGQVSSAGEEEQVSSAGGSGQVSPTGGSSQVSPTGEGGSGQGCSSGESGSGQVSPTGESGSGQVSSAGESGQVSPTGEGGSSQVSSAGESGQVSPTGDSGSPNSEVGTPGQVRGTPGDGIETPGQVRGTPGCGIETPGQVRGTPGHGRGTPGQVRGTPGHGRGTPGQVRGTPGHGRGTPGQVRGTPGHGRGTPGQVRGTFGVGLGTPGVRWKHLEMG
ncbi:hornerin-like [Haemorhous mexicanus]|uniref:hornerin-like n=1 Tax=Haemorhous mexicanus TaxID=30427 RepID=UPI0028BEAB37|nr:hornerin-like [Haemorhous mexicanus]